MQSIDTPGYRRPKGGQVNKRVLVAEDETDLRKMMKILLEIHGFDVIEAADGYEAVEKAVDESPDLILMEMAMPVLGGLDSTRSIRLHEELDDVPIVALITYGDYYKVRDRHAGSHHIVLMTVD